MKGNKLNAILWLLLGVFLTVLLIRGINGKSWKNFKFWTWHNETVKDWDEDFDRDADWETENDYVKWSFDSEDIRNIEVEIVSAHLTCKVSDDTDKIEVLISNNTDVRKIYSVGVNDSTFYLRRKAKVQIGIIPAINSSAKEIILILPDTVFDKMKIDNVSGRTDVKNLRGRKINIDNVSGKINAENLNGKVYLNSVSGKIECRIEELKNNLQANSVSGKIEMNISKDADFLCEFETVSGSVETDFHKAGKKSGEISNGSEEYELKVETVSGSIEINSL